MSEIMEKSSQIGQKLPKSPLGRGSSSWGEEEEEWGGARAGEKGDIAVGHLYRATTRVGTNVLTFVWGGCSDRYKCAGLTFVPVGASTRYKCEAFVPGGLHQAFIPVVKIPNINGKSKPWTNLPFFSSASQINCLLYVYKLICSSGQFQAAGDVVLAGAMIKHYQK
jgi:hypothetical protein